MVTGVSLTAGDLHDGFRVLVTRGCLSLLVVGFWLEGKTVDRQDTHGIPKFCCEGLWGKHCSQTGDHGALL
jgi:hypothetical protein